MKTAEVRDRGSDCREDVARAFENKQAHEALLAITARYRGLAADDRAVIDEVIVEELRGRAV
jgi:hypothetical protein